ncbi:GNAT family N-acetyltransferase [Pseudonocardia sp. DR1-2]|uniref:GNAT family N-acetyltransferase n=1 Tax=Pseudonocardia sp. DR1-2 TaxID=2951168 RepID=UPI0020449527|nr:GNAT family N-acetyltransferase [Pseudonocardia sp. DR1-2]MCM3845059.1 GNAT family N-acetyltransferase [Pseudonocardia sp. DR1-2]
MPVPVLRRATARDVPSVVALLADDPLGATRETPEDLAPYLAAFAELDADPRHLLLVADDDTVVGTLQLSLLPGLARRGALRARIEAVRVAAGRRGDGLGATMVRYAVDEARRRGAALVQLTSDRSRTDAHRFYERLGFLRTHDGFSLPLT